MTAEQIIALLGLERGTCGYMGLTYRNPLAVAPDAAGGRRRVGAAGHHVLARRGGR